MTTREFISTVYVVKDNKILLTWNKTCQLWVPVGGHIEPNELPCESVIREAKEESGLDIKIFCKQNWNLPQPFYIHVDHVKDDHHHINLTYLGTVIGGEFMPISDENTENRFFSKEDLDKEDIHPEIRLIAKKALEILS